MVRDHGVRGKNVEVTGSGGRKQATSALAL